MVKLSSFTFVIRQRGAQILVNNVTSYLLTTGRCHSVEAENFSYECVLIGMDMTIIVRKHTQKNLHDVQ
jgi:hypothetical protein